MINQDEIEMLTGRLKYLLGIFLIIVFLVLVAGGKLFFKTKLKKSPAFKRSEIVGIITSLGSEGEFSLEKEGEIVFQNKAGDQPKIKCRIVHRYEVKPASWEDLREDDRATLNIYYDSNGQVESRILKIYRTGERAIEP